MLIIDSRNFLPPTYREIFGTLPECFLPIGTTNLLLHSIRSSNSDVIIVILPERYNMPQSSDLYPANVKFFNSGASFYNHLNSRNIPTHENIRFIHSLALCQNEDLSGIPFYKEKIAQSIELPPFITEFDKTKFSHKGPNYELNSNEIFQNQLIDITYKSIESVDLRFSSNYFKARIHLVNIRFFNKLTCIDNKLQKTVDNYTKAQDESNWYNSVSKILPHRIPSLVKPCSAESNTYTIEYLPMVSLAEIYTFSIIEVNQWELILREIQGLIKELRGHIDPGIANTDSIKANLNYLLFEKTELRFKDYCHQHGFDVNSEIHLNGVKVCSNFSEIISNCRDIVMKQELITSIFHGDMCLSNILYDSRTSVLKLIDPRGISLANNQLSPKALYGPLNYDLAKLAHSLIGNYDLIIAGKMGNASISHRPNILNIECIFSIDDYHRSIIKMSEEFQITNEFNISKFYPSCVMLFMSMLPLHADSKQRQVNLFANALSLYVDKVL